MVGFEQHVPAPDRQRARRTLERMLDGPSWLLRRPPTWARWTLSLGVATLLSGALVLFVSHHNDNRLAAESPKAAERANREAEIVVSEDQAPHAMTLRGRASRAAVTGAIRHDMTVRISEGQAAGPLQRVGCTTTARRGRQAGYRCRAIAAGVGYPYQAVLDRSTRRLTFCKHDTPPVPSMNIPVSHRCRL
jgi:hypothetical protein